MEDLEYYKHKPRIIEKLAEEIFLELKNRPNFYEIIILKNGESEILKDFAYSLEKKLIDKLNDPDIINFEYPYEFVVVQASLNENLKTLENLIKTLKDLNNKYLPIIYGFDPGNEKIKDSFIFDFSRMIKYYS